ncbi:putative sorbitol dehydrogenase [Venturia nashicola]|uniref:Putative sorbitol dehydrogenase n=1 Tax=Venturia nashicola TaxID=86259 RepID=A0A4Z1PCZ4_9PEZI|nr:putative sorbitol dehydrogenase [Venturia nashicola]
MAPHNDAQEVSPPTNGKSMGQTYTIPTEMKAIRYNKVKDWSLVTMPVPKPRAHEILVKVKSCGVCGTDLHIHNGDFDSKMPVVTGHETSGIVVQIGDAVNGFTIGDKVTADNSELCGYCHFCREGKLLYCENFAAHGVHLDGGFAEYCVFPAEKLFKFHNLSWEEASLFEAASCAVHGMDRIRPEIGSSVLLIGSGATGLCLAQLLRGNGGQHVVLASNAGPKMELAKKLDCADEYIELSREDPGKQWSALKEQYPYGFDVVVEASGSVKVLEMAIDFCARGGKLVYYGVYPKEALIAVSPQRVFSDEITMIGSFSEMWCVGRSVKYLESRKVDVRGIVDKTFRLEQFGEALDAVRNKTCIKAAIVFD